MEVDFPTFFYIVPYPWLEKALDSVSLLDMNNVKKMKLIQNYPPKIN